MTDTWKDIPTTERPKRHPSTWEAEVKALRVRVEALEAALAKIVLFCHAYPGIADGAGEIARAALQQEDRTDG